MDLTKEYWDNRYFLKDTAWDKGSITTPLKEYFDQLTTKEVSILIPGAGNGYEAEYLYHNGFKNLFVCDISEHPLKLFNSRCPDFPSSHLIREDFFQLKGTYDLIIEQTFFCALDPTLRQKYAKKCAELLRPGGKLVGLLFNTQFTNSPPFGGTKEEYLAYFKEFFEIRYFDECYNSIPQRAGRELFIYLIKK